MSILQLTINHAVLNKSSDTFGKMENYVLVKANLFGQTTEYKTTIKDGEAKKKDKDNRIIWNETLNI